MRPDDGARLVHHITLAACGTAFAQQAAVIAVGHETDLLALWLLCGDKTARSGRLAHFRLRHAAKWKASSRDSGTVEPMQEIRLILLGVDSGAQSPRAPIIRDGATRIVPRSNRVAAKECTPLPHQCAELHRCVAANTGARRLTALIRRDKGLQDRIRELLLEILNVERDAKMVGDTTRIVGGIQGAATLAVAVTLIGGAVESHPDTHHFMTCFSQECGGDR
jgi:hypothetical protein